MRTAAIFLAAVVLLSYVCCLVGEVRREVVCTALAQH